LGWSASDHIRYFYNSCDISGLGFGLVVSGLGLAIIFWPRLRPQHLASASASLFPGLVNIPVSLTLPTYDKNEKTLTSYCTCKLGMVYYVHCACSDKYGIETLLLVYVIDMPSLMFSWIAH